MCNLSSSIKVVVVESITTAQKKKTTKKYEISIIWQETAPLRRNTKYFFKKTKNKKENNIKRKKNQFFIVLAPNSSRKSYSFTFFSCWMRLLSTHTNFFAWLVLSFHRAFQRRRWCRHHHRWNVSSFPNNVWMEFWLVHIERQFPIFCPLFLISYSMLSFQFISFHFTLFHLKRSTWVRKLPK